MAKFQHFGIAGAGAWGTALAVTLLRGGRDVSLWAHEKETVADINQHHENKVFLPGVKLDAGLKATTGLAALAGCDALILAVPAQHLRAIAKLLHKAGGGAPAIIVAKGIEQNSLALLSEVAADEMPDRAVAILSGPSFAGEIARGLPAALTLAIRDQDLGQALAQAMALPQFRLYLSDDIIGAQIGGAVKNVLAVACGIATGKKMGDSARAALITRGLAELVRLGTAMGGRAETLMGLSGLGDLVLTCSSPQSRNMSLGMALGEGKSLEEILGSRKSVSEGVYTASAALELAKKHNVDMPVVMAVDAVLNRHADIDAMIAGLLARPLKPERH